MVSTPHLEYGVDYVDLGFKSGNEAVIKTIASDFAQYYSTDSKGTAISQIPMMQGVSSLASFDLMLNVSAGYPGSKEWVLYAATPLKKPLVVGCTGVQAPLMYPYIPDQVQGLLGAIKGAAEYEFIVNRWTRKNQILKALVSGGIKEKEAEPLAEEFARDGASGINLDGDGRRRCDEPRSEDGAY